MWYTRGYTIHNYYVYLKKFNHFLMVLLIFFDAPTSRLTLRFFVFVSEACCTKFISIGIVIEV